MLFVFESNHSCWAWFLSFGPLYWISYESLIFREWIFKNKFCLRKLIKSRAKLRTNDWILYMRLLNICYKCDSSEYPFISTIIWGAEIHLSQIFMINVFNLMESSVSAETSVATLGLRWGCLLLRASLVIWHWWLSTRGSSLQRLTLRRWKRRIATFGAQLLSTRIDRFSWQIPSQLDCSWIIYTYILVPSVILST